MTLSLEQSKARGILTKVLQRHYVELDNNLKQVLNNLLEELNYDEVSLTLIAELLEIVADSNYKLGAERQREAFQDNISKLLKM